MFWFSQPSGDRSVTPLNIWSPLIPPTSDGFHYSQFGLQPWCAMERRHGVLTFATTVTTWTALPADVPWASAHQHWCLSSGKAWACLPLWPVTRFPYTEPQSHSRYTPPRPWQGIWPQGLPTAQLCLLYLWPIQIKSQQALPWQALSGFPQLLLRSWIPASLKIGLISMTAWRRWYLFIGHDKFIDTAAHAACGWSRHRVGGKEGPIRTAKSQIMPTALSCS